MGLYIYKLNQISLNNGIPWNHVELKSIRSLNIEVLIKEYQTSQVFWCSYW